MQDGEGFCLDTGDGGILAGHLAQDPGFFAYQGLPDRGLVGILLLNDAVPFEQNQGIGAVILAILFLIADQLAEEAWTIVQFRIRVDVGGRQALVYLAIDFVGIEEETDQADNLTVLIERPLVAGDAMRNALDDTFSGYILDSPAFMQDGEFILPVRLAVGVPVHILVGLADEVRLGG